MDKKIGEIKSESAIKPWKDQAKVISASQDILYEALLEAGQSDLAKQLERYRVLTKGGNFNEIVDPDEYQKFTGRITMLAVDGVIPKASERIKMAETRLGKPVLN